MLGSKTQSKDRKYIIHFTFTMVSIAHDTLIHQFNERCIPLMSRVGVPVVSVDTIVVLDLRGRDSATSISVGILLFGF